MSQSGQSDPLLGRILDGKFTLLSVLGRGGMGVVYRAHQQSLERPVALKLMMASPPVDDGEEAREEEEARQQEYQRRFFLEAATAAKLKHPNTITVFDYGSTLVDGDKVFYITMELLDGITLSRLLARQGPLPPLRAINIALQMCRSLREAHVDGIVHRDLKPGNVMLVRHDAHGDGDGDVNGDGDDDDGDFVKVLDFGLAKNRSAPGMPARQLTKAGTFLGSPRYVAPEQIEGRPVDGRADIYSFGCVFYRMLTGRVPFDGQQAVQVMLKHLHDPVPPLSTAELKIAPVLEQLVLKCLAKKATDRPSSMDEVIIVLKRARAEVTGILSGNISIPDDLRLRLARELGEGAHSGPMSIPSASKQSLPPAPTTHEVRRTPRSQGYSDPWVESTSPSHPSPSHTSSSHTSSSQQVPADQGLLNQAQTGGGAETSSSLSAPSTSLSSSSASSFTGPPPPGPLSASGEWKIGMFAGGPIDDSTRPTRVLDRLSTQAPPRKAGSAVAAGVGVGLFLAAVAIAGRLGHLDALSAAVIAAVGGSAAPTSTSAPPRVPRALATVKVSARLRIMTEPAGADVFDVGGALPLLLGITPLLLPWEIAVGDPGRELLLKLPGHVAARARVDPPLPSSANEAVLLDVNATLRPQSPR